MSEKEKIKVLHIGNIANNAYQNAKILNAGDEYDCDVLCNDYYHIMGCPEWDEAEFDSRGINQFYPNWNKINLHGYKRPRWFIQGKLDLCIKYLINRRRGHYIITSLLWHYIRVSNSIYTFFMNSEAKTLERIFNALGRMKHLISFCIEHPNESIHILIKKIIGNTKQDVLTEREVIAKKEESIEREDTYEKELQNLRNKFKQYFPQRECLFGELTKNYIRVKKKWKELFKEYDIIEAYAYNSIYPLITGEKNYVAFEHGTIRDIEEDNTELSQLVMLAYANATVIYSTNTDCYKSAKYITANTDAQIICGYHGLDVEAIVRKQAESSMSIDYPLYNILNDNTTVFFAPARFTYDDKKRCFLKGQEIYLQAAQSLLSDGLDFKILIIEWGDDVSEMKNLINKTYPELKYHIIWTQPLEKKTYYYVMQHADAVIDQLQLRAFGAIAIEALCSEKAVLITMAIPEEDQIRYWGSPAPVMFVEDKEAMEIVMKRIIMEPEESRKIARDERKWVLENHSKEQIYKSCRQAFMTCMNSD